MAAKAGTARLAAAKRHQLALVDRLQRGNYPAIGPAFAHLRGEDLADALVASRLTKHFVGGEQLSPNERRDRTLSAMIEYDNQGLTDFDWRKLPQPLRGQFLQAKNALAGFFAGMKRNHRFRPPSGETAEPSQGKVDLLFKLVQCEQWLVSFEAASEAAAVCYHNPKLKSIVKERFREKFSGAYRSMCEAWYDDVVARGLSNPRFRVFVKQFTACCVIQNYSRLSTVIKNAFSDRPISMEPLWNMIAQLSFAADLRSHLRCRLGIDLNSRAALHRTLIRHAANATVDFRNASNSNWLAVLASLLPKRIYGKLCDLRTPVCYYKGHFHHYNMLAPMGCGFTFEVMTIVLLHLARVLDPGATVFGDDVIIKADKAQEFISLCEALGWKVNGDKTFIEGNFRESCGGFHDLSTGTDLLSFEMHQIETAVDHCVTVNKLFRLIEKEQISADLRGLLTEFYSKLLSELPHDVWRAVGETLEQLPEGVALVPDKVRYWTKQDDTPITLLLSSYLHREVPIGRQYTTTLPTVEVEASPRVTLATYLHRGGSYKPTLRGSDKVVKKTVLAVDNVDLASLPLFSFI